MNRKVAELHPADSCAVKTIDEERVIETRKRIINREEAERLSSIFRLLGDTTRIRLLYALLEAKELCVCDLAATVEMPETSVSHALRLLRTAQIVRPRREGRMIYYRLDDEHVRPLLDLARQHILHGFHEEGTEKTRPMKGRK